MKTHIFKKLMQEIGNIYGVCGLMGNIEAESGMRSNNAQDSCMKRLNMTDESYTKAVDDGIYSDFGVDRVGYGLCQWTSAGRKTALLAFAKEAGKSIADEDMQLDFLMHELSTSYKSVLNVLKSADSVKTASDIVVIKFERPASVGTDAIESQKAATLAKRQALGEAFYNEFAGYEMEDKKMLRIAIDAGHYINTSGKRCMKKFDPNETREWTLNDRIADKLEKLLRAYNCEVLRIDDTTGLIDTSLSNRCKKSNNWNADVYISIHHNGGIKGGSGGGTVVFYYSSKPERKTQAQDLYNSIVAATGLIGNRSSKVVKKNYYVLSNTNAAAFLVENGFMDSATDVPIILSEEHAEKTAQGLLNFLVKEYSLIKKAVNPQEIATNVVYRVQCGAFKNKNNAEALKEQLKAAGYPAIVVST